MCLAQGHNAVTPVRLEPAALRSRVKHSTTEPLRSLDARKQIDFNLLRISPEFLIDQNKFLPFLLLTVVQ